MSWSVIDKKWNAKVWLGLKLEVDVESRVQSRDVDLVGTVSTLTIDAVVSDNSYNCSRV